jgi:replicative DNA helicase/sulfur relay (sulfurtransferase) DsrC/TusE family protein
MANLEAKTLSAALNDRQVHILLQANAGQMLITHLDIWDFIRNYYEQNQTVPPIDIVQERFPDFDYSKDTGATKHHLDELRTEFLNNNVKIMLRAAASQLQDGDSITALETLMSETARLKHITSTARDLDVSDVDDAIAYFENIKRLQESGTHGIYTGLAGFDNYLPAGITPGQLGVLLAYPAIGKSWMALYLAVQAWKNGKSPLIVSLEMTETEVRNRVFTIIGQGMWSHRKLSRGDVETDMMKKWMHKTFDGRPSIHIISNDGIGEVSPSVLRGKIDQYKPDIVFVDYLNLMTSNQRTDNEVVKMKNLSRELKLLAISEQIPIVAISSATPDDITDMNSVPTLGQTSWSRQIAYDADWLLALGRAANSDVLEAVFRKNRNGFLGEFVVQVDFDSGRFVYKDFE